MRKRAGPEGPLIRISASPPLNLLELHIIRTSALHPKCLHQYHQFSGGTGLGKKDPGLLESVFEVAIAMPAVGFIAAILFAGLGACVRPLSTAKTIGLGTVVVVTFWGFAAASCLGGILGPVQQRIRRGQRSRRLADQRSVDDLLRLSPRAFEEVIADLFRREGYLVEEVGGPGDGGMDLILRRQGDGSLAHLVQCKRYRNWKVAVREVREFYGAMASQRTRCEGLFVTCGNYTRDARAFAMDKAMRLIDGAELVSMLNKINPVTLAVASFTAPQSAAQAPLCLTCGVPMQRRLARQGLHVGKPFWGCQNYPSCRQIQRMENSWV